MVLYLKERWTHVRETRDGCDYVCAFAHDDDGTPVPGSNPQERQKLIKHVCMYGCESNRPRIFLPPRFVHKTPFESTGETCPSTTAKARILNGLNDPGISFQ
jgi:hypothetical protein